MVLDEVCARSKLGVRSLDGSTFVGLEMSDNVG